MLPDKNNSRQGGKPLLGQQGRSVPVPDKVVEETRKTREAAANVIRGQINELFDEQQKNAPETELPDVDPYERSHTDDITDTPLTNDWQEYHSAWQNYYQQYYKGYYEHRQDIKQKQQEAGGIFANNEEAFRLRQKLLGKVSSSATKVKKSRHFMPIVVGIMVLLLFLFLQYNQVIIANIVSYVSPGNINPQNIVINPDDNTSVSADPKLIIPKINVDVPVLYDVGSDYDSQMTAMTKGVAQFSIPGANAHPGQIGNTVISGHSSNDLFDTGDYKFIFAQLEKLVVGDTIYLNYNSIRYTYTVTKTEVVKPTEVNKLVYTTTKPMLTLITCTPLGTSTNRLLVTAEQVNPDPNKAEKASETTTTDSTTMPGATKSWFETLFNL